jgi:hypothetical protein
MPILVLSGWVSTVIVDGLTGEKWRLLRTLAATRFVGLARKRYQRRIDG